VSIVAEDVFADRIEQYIERHPDASAPEVLGRFMIEPSDEHREFVENLIGDDGDEAETPQTDSKAGSAGGII